MIFMRSFSHKYSLILWRLLHFCDVESQHLLPPTGLSSVWHLTVRWKMIWCVRPVIRIRSGGLFLGLRDTLRPRPRIRRAFLSSCKQTAGTLLRKSPPPFFICITSTRSYTTMTQQVKLHNNKSVGTRHPGERELSGWGTVVLWHSRSVLVFYSDTQDSGLYFKTSQDHISRHFDIAKLPVNCLIYFLMSLLWLDVKLPTSNSTNYVAHCDF